MCKPIVLLVFGFIVAAAHIPSSSSDPTSHGSVSFLMTSALADQPAQDGTELAQSQDPPASDDGKADTDVNVNVTREEKVVSWYADPLWIGVGIAIALLVIILVALAVRGGGGTTIVRG